MSFLYLLCFLLCSQQFILKLIRGPKVDLTYSISIVNKFLNMFYNKASLTSLQPASVAQLDVRPTGNQEVPGPTLIQDRQHYFMEIDHEIISVIILSLSLIQEGQLSVSGERMCTILVNRLED